MGVIRTIRPWERAKLREHLLRLEPEGRRMRFHAAVKDSAIERFVDRLSWLRSINAGFFEDGALRGSAQLVWSADPWRDGVEFAIAVETAWRGRGVGTALMDRALILARNRGLDRLTMTCLRENDAMRALARHFEARLAFEDNGVEGRLRLPWPSQATLAQEAAEEWFAAMRQGIETVARLGLAGAAAHETALPRARRAPRLGHG